MGFPYTFPLIFSPEIGSWQSNLLTGQPVGSVVLNFVAEFFTGSSEVQYGVLNSSGSPLLAYTTPSFGSNSIDISAYTTSDYYLRFYLSGDPDTGGSYLPTVSAMSVDYTGGTAQTTNLGSDVLLSTTKFTSGYVKLEGDNYWLASGSLSSDGGATWTPITTLGAKTTITSTTGSEPVVKLTSNTGSPVITKAFIYFHTGDVN